MEVYVKYLLFPYFLFLSRFSTMILSDALILPALQFQTRKVITSQISSHVNTHLLYSFARFVVEIDEKYSLNGGF